MVDRFTGMDKVYTGVLRLGEGTPSQDAATEVDEEEPWEHVTDDALLNEAAAMVGEITQIPPMYSAIKVKGERLYKAARRGETVERKERKCIINSFEVSRDDPEDARNVSFRVDCSKGTYVRTLAFDLGKRLGSIAHLTSLRRESIGEYDVRDAWTTDALFEACGPQLEACLEAKRESRREKRRLVSPRVRGSPRVRDARARVGVCHRQRVCFKAYGDEGQRRDRARHGGGGGNRYDVLVHEG
jgi:tRNA pseudouridine55 synthase